MLCLELIAFQPCSNLRSNFENTNVKFAWCLFSKAQLWAPPPQQMITAQQDYEGSVWCSALARCSSSDGSSELDCNYFSWLSTAGQQRRTEALSCKQSRHLRAPGWWGVRGVRAPFLCPSSLCCHTTTSAYWMQRCPPQQNVLHCAPETKASSLLMTDSYFFVCCECEGVGESRSGEFRVDSSSSLWWKVKARFQLSCCWFWLKGISDQRSRIFD